MAELLVELDFVQSEAQYYHMNAMIIWVSPLYRNATSSHEQERGPADGVQVVGYNDGG